MTATNGSRVFAPLSSNVPLQQQDENESRETSTNESNGPVLTRQEMFLVFVKVIFLYIKSKKDRTLQRQVAAVISECTRRNRRGDPDYSPLQDAVEKHLRESLGLLHFTQAKLCFDSYCVTRRIRVVDALVHRTTTTTSSNPV